MQKLSNSFYKRFHLKKPIKEFKSIDTKALQIPKGVNNTELLAHLGALKELDGVEFAHPAYKIKIATIPNDPHFSKLWNFENTGLNFPYGMSPGLLDADIDAPEAWEVSTGSRSVIVGIIDTGMDYNHPDLVANVWRNPGETGTDGAGNDKSTNGIDDDGNGYIDDFRGWDFVSNDNDPFDENGHGTHVAGTIGASGNNAEGVVGVNWQVSLVPLQIFDSSGSGDLVGAMAALEYATQMKFPITNNSWGGGDYSAPFEELLKANRDAGALFVAAAGNDHADNDATPFYPASFNVDNVISVAASDNKDQLTNFSNYGKNTVHLAAPGDALLSTHIWGYYYEAGTSMASPHVAGAAALVKAVWPELNYSQIKTKILDSVDVIYNPSFAGKIKTEGRLNVARAVGGVPSPLPYRLALKSSSPAVGPLTGGTRITVKGTGFHPEVKVTVGLKPCNSLQVSSQMELSCVTTPSAISGLHNVTATNPDGNTRSLSGAFRYNPAPTITSLSSTAGTLAGGNRLTVNGNYFASGAKVKVGEKDCLQVQVSSASQLSCLLPAFGAGSYRVVVSNSYGQQSNENIQYTYRPAPQVTSVAPVKGSTAGGGLLSVGGVGLISGAKVKIGNADCLNPQWVSASQITCTLPAVSAGVYRVIVTNPEGQNSSAGTPVNYEAVSPRWVQTNGVSCLSVCSQQALVSKPSPEGAYCTSGEVVPNSARGVIKFTYGCRPNTACVAQGTSSGATSQARFCYGPNQRKDNLRTDITVGCYCGL